MKSQCSKNDLHCRILFAIVFIFFVCNTPRAVLNILELDHVASIYLGSSDTDWRNELQCYDPPFWALILKFVSSFSLTLNASLGFFIYCLTSKQFRLEIRSLFRR